MEMRLEPSDSAEEEVAYFKGKHSFNFFFLLWESVNFNFKFICNF
jgi:hypothetical protein